MWSNFIKLFSLKQAPRTWYEWLSKFLLKNNFIRGKIDETLFIKTKGNDFRIIQVYIVWPDLKTQPELAWNLMVLNTILCRHKPKINWTWKTYKFLGQTRPNPNPPPQPEYYFLIFFYFSLMFLICHKSYSYQIV